MSSEFPIGQFSNKIAGQHIPGSKSSLKLSLSESSLAPKGSSSNLKKDSNNALNKLKFEKIVKRFGLLTVCLLN